MTAMQSLLVALKSLVTLEQSEFHSLLSSASDQHDAEQKELDTLRTQVAALGAAAAPVDLSGLASASDLSALVSRVDGLDATIGQLTTEVSDLQADAAADAAAVTEDTPALVADPDAPVADPAAAPPPAEAAAGGEPADNTAIDPNVGSASGELAAG